MTTARPPDLELRLWLAWTRRLPPLPRALGLANHVARRIYCRRRRPPVLGRVAGTEVPLDPHELVDGLLLFAPHLVDRRERAFLRRHLRPTDTFLDGGAYLGAYSLHLADAVGRVVLIEADADAAEALRARVPGATVVHAALTDGVGAARVSAPTPGNAGHRVVGDQGAPVRTVDLAALASEVGVPRFDAVKLDLEGWDGAVVRHVLATVPSPGWPRVWVVEAQRGDDVVTQTLRDAGYRVRRLSRHNIGAVRAP